ncbi:Alkaline phosphatase, tissue-nonspecific isozyme [Orchesella cincta]|uniref:alkaline phosphatase n=1 Tax=Orchesella cincta TaxID=48709 RepID=A0A1D2N1P6_ORCCI|nr:Alkaline phosphatase, tissue-nonspecific isozyme [Orchesella cincta]
MLGLVTTTRITHATPAAAYGHSAHRDWECDSKIPEAELKKGCKDLGRQLIEDEPGKNINIILGGGEQVLRASINDSKSGACSRTDRRDLVWDWMKTQRELKRKYKFVKDKEQLLSADNDSYILGLFANSHMPYDKDRQAGDNGHPSLSEMVGKAIDVLEQNENGYLLIVEGGRIDHANHDNLAKIALEETVALDAAIEMTKQRVNLKDTLLVVTADHSHSMSINGYPKRGNPIEGVADVTPEGFAYQTLSYINGPGYNYHRVLNQQEKENDTLKSIHTWRNLNTTENLHGRYEPHHAGFWMDYETHGGEDVPVYAIGPMAHLFHGVHEQTHVPFTIAYSTCIGPYASKCRSDKSNRVIGSHSVSTHLPEFGALTIFAGFLSVFISNYNVMYF